jgi:hypothetical protein
MEQFRLTQKYIQIYFIISASWSKQRAELQDRANYLFSII